MTDIIHARLRGTEYRYRIWETTHDSYTTNEMTEYEIRQYLTKFYYNFLVTPRLIRARRNGTSSLDLSGRPGHITPERTDGSWEEERCQYCFDFHHEFVYAADTNSQWCRECDGNQDDVIHCSRCPCPPEELRGNFARY